ncbi:MAG: hypothetical protein R6U38_00730 [Desulfatiglandaceae bacterium]
MKELKAIQQKEGKPLGRLISDLLARVLGEKPSIPPSEKPSQWISKAMGVRVDLVDREALYAAMDRETRSSKKPDKS